MAPHQKAALKIDGRSVGYDCPVALNAGRGLPLVFTHSSSFDRSVWQPQLNHFAREHTPIAFDLPGHGETDGPACERIEDYRQFLKRVVAALEIQKIVLIGHSLGGAIAQDYALAYPEDVRGIVLISTALRFGTSDAQIQRWRAYPDEFKAFKEKSAEASSDTSPEVLKQLSAFRQRIPVNSQLADMAALSRWNNTSRFSTIACPISLITGESDTLLASHREMHRLAPHAAMVVLPNVGHLMLLEQPDVVTQAIAAWLSSRLEDRSEATR